MISKSKATEILKNLFGVDSSTMNRPQNVYLGLSAEKPDASGYVGEGEPTAAGCEYVRILVGGVNAKETFFNTSAAKDGKISNTAEIKFKTAKAAYGKKMMYWFLSEGSSKSNPAFLWGRLKDVLLEKGTKAFTETDATNKYVFSQEVDDLLNMADNTDYVVWWRNPSDTKDAGKEYDVKSTTYTTGGKTYIHLGNPVVKGGTDDKTPFAVLYNQETEGAETKGYIKIYSIMPGNFEVAVYGLGIDVKKATVPTFYDGELTASIEVQTDEN